MREGIEKLKGSMYNWLRNLHNMTLRQKRWLNWAQRCRLEPIRKFAKTIKAHFYEILNAVALKVTNNFVKESIAELTNSKWGKPNN